MARNPNPKISAIYDGITERHGNGKIDWTGQVKIIEDRLLLPLKWQRPRRVFVNSMSDLFHKDVSFDFIRRSFEVMQQAHWHRFQVLTKRSDRLLKLSPRLPWPENVWMGVSVENADYVHRIDHLRQTGARIKFLSLEPLLGPLPNLDLTGIHWVIVGGESGPNARPMHPDWARSLRDQCIEAGVPFLFKQWGEWMPWKFEKNMERRQALHLYHPWPDGTSSLRVGKKAAGRMLDGRLWDEYPVTT